MTFEELKEEYEKSGIGEKIYSLLLEMCSLVARKYPKDVYNNRNPWDKDSFMELRQEVVLERLIEEEQIHYIFGRAENLDQIRALLTRQIRFTLAARREITPVDRLITRVKAHASRGDIESEIKSRKYVFRAKGSGADAVPLNDRQIIECVNLLRPIPVIYTRLDTSRETMIYSPTNLLTALNLLFGHIGAVSEGDLREILKNLLTPWLRTILESDMEEHVYAIDPTAQPQIQEIIFQEARSFIGQLSDEEKVVLVHKSQEISDDSIAKTIGVSRPTVAKIKEIVLEKVKSQFLNEIEVDDMDFAMRVLIDEIVNQTESLKI